MKLLGFLLLGLVASAGAQAPLAPIWTRPAFPNISDLSYNAQTDRIAVLTPTQLIVFNRGSQTSVWQIPINGGSSDASAGAVQFSPNGQFILVAGNPHHSAFRPRIYDANTGSFLRYLLTNPNATGHTIFGPANPTDSAYPAGGDLLVSGTGFVRLSDGAVVGPREDLETTDDSTFDPTGRIGSFFLGIGLTMRVGNSSASGGIKPPIQVGPDSNHFVMDDSDDTGNYFGVFQIHFDIEDRPAPIRQARIGYPNSFIAQNLRRLGTGTRYLAYGYEPVGDHVYRAAVVIDTATKKLVDHRIFSSEANVGAFEVEGESGFLFGSNVRGRSTIFEAPVSAAGKIGAAVAIMENPEMIPNLAAGPNDAGIVAQGGANAGSVDLINGSTGALTRKIAKESIPIFPISLSLPQGSSSSSRAPTTASKPRPSRRATW